jgi:hypothetical protein
VRLWEDAEGVLWRPEAGPSGSVRGVMMPLAAAPKRRGKRRGARAAEEAVAAHAAEAVGGGTRAPARGAAHKEILLRFFEAVPESHADAKAAPPRALTPPARRSCGAGSMMGKRPRRRARPSPGRQTQAPLAPRERPAHP